MSGIFGKKHKSRKVPPPTIPTIQPESQQHHHHEEVQPAEQAVVNNVKNGTNGHSEAKERLLTFF